MNEPFLPSGTILRRSGEVFEQDIDGDSLLYSADREAVIHLNATAAVIWKLCDGQRTTDEIVELLLSQYPGGPTEIEHDIRGTFALLLQNGALTAA